MSQSRPLLVLRSLAGSRWRVGDRRPLGQPIQPIGSVYPGNATATCYPPIPCGVCVSVRCVGTAGAHRVKLRIAFLEK